MSAEPKFTPWALPAAFEPMRFLRQWIVYQLHSPEGGKYQKRPIDHRIGKVPAKGEGGPEIWTDCATAANIAALLGPGYGVGFYFTEADPFWFLDIDGALQSDNSWSDLAKNLCAKFPGAAVEISSSGRGLHIIGSGKAPPHGCKNTANGIELYTADRWVALTGTGVTGSAATDHTAALAALIAEYFSKSVSIDSAEWTTEPHADYDGPTDDDELLRRMLAARPPAGAVFGSRASLADLWNNNVEALARAFPSQSPGKDYDASSADLALGNYFGFWTGGDCERMLRLMLRSNLKREKWERDDYIRETILRAAKQKNYYKQRAPVVSAGTEPLRSNAEGVPLPPCAMPEELPAVLVLNRKMQFEATIEALSYVLGTQRQASIGYDEFRGRIMIAPAGTEEWRPLSDTDMIQLRESLAREQRFAPIGKELMHDALLLVASRHRFDSAITWLNGLQWDDVPRIERFLVTYCGTVDDEYARAVGLYIWTGLAGRVLDPGCQLDMVVAFQSPQGKMKSTGFQAMVPADDYFTDGLSLQDDDDNFKRLIRGKLVIEVAELAGLSKADINVVKRVITRRHEEWIEKWQTQPTRFKRRCMLFASTNEERFLPQDDTGQRRWVPVEIAKLDRDRIAQDRDQLWAEGAARWKELGGVAWKDAERLAAGRHSKYEQTDVWESTIKTWLRTPGALDKVSPGDRPLTITEVLAGAIGLNAAHQDSKAEKRAARVMKQLGFEARSVRVDGETVRRWVRR